MTLPNLLPMNYLLIRTFSWTSIEGSGHNNPFLVRRFKILFFNEVLLRVFVARKCVFFSIAGGQTNQSQDNLQRSMNKKEISFRPHNNNNNNNNNKNKKLYLTLRIRTSFKKNAWTTRAWMKEIFLTRRSLHVQPSLAHTFIFLPR